MATKRENALTCQLLCASNAAYGVAFSDAAQLTELQPYFGKTGFLGSDVPTAFAAGARGIHACLVGTLSDPTLPRPGNSIVIAFRGTHPPDISGIPDAASFLRDGANNFEAAPIDSMVRVQERVQFMSFSAGQRWRGARRMRALGAHGTFDNRT